MRLSVPRSGGWRAWGAIRGEFERRLAEQESRTLKSRAIGWTELSTSSALVPWQVTFAPVLGRSRGRPATTMRHRRGPDPRPLSLCRSVRREDATTGTGHPGTAPARSYGVDATSTSYERHGWDIHAVTAGGGCVSPVTAAQRSAAAPGGKGRDATRPSGISVRRRPRRPRRRRPGGRGRHECCGTPAA